MKKLKKLSLENVEILSEQETMFLMGGDGCDSTYVAPRDTTSRPKSKITHSITGSIVRTPKDTRFKLGYKIDYESRHGKFTGSGYVDYGPGGFGGGGTLTYTFPKR